MKLGMHAGELEATGRCGAGLASGERKAIVYLVDEATEDLSHPCLSV